MGCRFHGSSGCFTQIWKGNDVHDTGGHLGEISEGQCDLHFYKLDVRRNIVDWVSFLGVSGLLAQIWL